MLLHGRRLFSIDGDIGWNPLGFRPALTWHTLPAVSCWIGYFHATSISRIDTNFVLIYMLCLHCNISIGICLKRFRLYCYYSTVDDHNIMKAFFGSTCLLSFCRSVKRRHTKINEYWFDIIQRWCQVDHSIRKTIEFQWQVMEIYLEFFCRFHFHLFYWFHINDNEVKIDWATSIFYIS